MRRARKRIISKKTTSRLNIYKRESKRQPDNFLSPYSLPPPIRHPFPLNQLPNLVGCSPKRRTRDGVARLAFVDVEEDSSIGPLVQAGAWNAGRGRDGSAARNLQVQALGVHLGAVVLLTAVQGDDLVADDVVACFEVLWQDGRCGEAVFDERVGWPGGELVCACVCMVGEVLGKEYIPGGAAEAGFGEFGPAEGAGCQGCAVTCLQHQSWLHLFEESACIPLQGAM